MEISDEARAVTPKFGDTVLNRVASEGNPQRTGTFVRKIRRSGRLNPGVWWQITDGRGSFWETPPAIAEVQPAPDIARAAQVQVLRELADEFNSFHNDGADPMVERTLRVLILRLHGKANELEAGAGQTGERNG